MSGLARLFRRHIVVVVACIVVGTGVATAIAVYAVTPSYTASAKLYVSGRGATSDDRLQNGEYARTHISSYTDMVQSNELLQAVRDNLGVPRTSSGGYADLADSITASNPLDTSIIDVTVEADSPGRAVSVAGAVAAVYNSVVDEAESATSEQSPVRVSILSVPTLPTHPSSPNVLVYAAAGLMVGALAGVGSAQALEVRASRRRRRVPEAAASESWSWDVTPVSQRRRPSAPGQPVDLTERRSRGDAEVHDRKPVVAKEHGAPNKQHSAVQ